LRGGIREWGFGIRFDYRLALSCPNRVTASAGCFAPVHGHELAAGSMLTLLLRIPNPESVLLAS